MIAVQYFYSACVSLTTPELSILCDPWFTEGAYDGSWYHYPPFECPLKRIPDCRYIYISHIHPDHYDARFLKAYLSHHPNTQVIISDFKTNFLAAKMRADNIPHKIVTDLVEGETRVRLFNNESTEYDIDSALVVVWRDQSVVNMNDNLFNVDQVQSILEYIGSSPTIALIGYTGAGPYPQTYYEDPQVLEEKAEQKKTQFFARYKRMCNALDAKINIPFAGKYILGGKLHGLNRFRGVADATEVLAFDCRAVVLADGGNASIDTHALCASDVRIQPYDPIDYENYGRTLSNRKMDYEEWFERMPADAPPLKRLLPKAYKNALARSACDTNYYFCIGLPGDEPNWFVCNARKESCESRVAREINLVVPRSEVYIDPRYLFGLITGVFHWNNAEVGSQYQCRRIPDKFNREAQAFLSFFQV